MLIPLLLIRKKNNLVLVEKLKYFLYFSIKNFNETNLFRFITL